MDVRMTITTGGGKKANQISYSKTLKDVATWDEMIADFKVTFDAFFVKYQTLDKVHEKKARK